MNKHFGGFPAVVDVATALRLLGANHGPVETLGRRLAAGSSTLVLQVGRGRRTRYYVSGSHLLAANRPDPEAVIVAELTSQANVLLLDDVNLEYYQRGGRHEYVGGLATVSPYRVEPKEDTTVVITVYEPSPLKWDPTFRVRTS